ANIDKLFGSLIDGVVDASDLHTHDDRYVQLSSTSAQDFGTGGYNTTGASSVGSATNFTNTILSVKTTADNKVGLAVRANAVTQSADLFQVQDNSGTALMSVSSAGAISSAASTITSTAGNQLTVKYDTTNKMTLNVSSAGVSSFTAAGSSPLIALLGGDVGIGTSSPDRPLHVTSASAPTILQENTAAGADQKIRYSTTTTSGDMAWGKFTDNMSSSTEHMRLMSSGNLGVGVTNATAVLHLKAGTATASTAPLKFTSGTLLSTPEDGAIEFLSPDFYATSAGTRYKIALISGTGDFTSVTNSSGAITLSAGGTNQNVTLSPSGTGVVTTSSPTTITNATASTSSSTGALVVSGGVGVGGDIFTAGNVSSGGVFLSPLGAAATPSYSFTGDTNTGVFSPASDTWAVSTAGSERIRVDSSGNVGIGTTTPSAALNVESANNPPVMFTRTATASSSTIVAGAVKSKTTAVIANGYGVSLSFRIEASGVAETSYGGIAYVRDGADNSSKINFNNLNAGVSQTPMVISAAGNVGIGTNSPTNLLSFGGNAARTIWMERHTTANTAGNNLTLQAGGATSTATDKNGGDLILSSGTATGTGTSSISFQTATAQGSTSTTDNAPTTKMTILGNGNVGIGTTNPTRALSVVGMTSVTSSTQYGGSFWSNGTNTIADIKGSSASNDTGMLGLYTGGTKNIQLVATGNSYLNGGNLGIGTTSPAYTLDVAGNGGNVTAIFGADNSATTRTDATQKTTRLGVPHYTNAEEPMALFYASSAAATNSITIGGGTSLLNAATQISLYTAANNTTTTGTERVRIDSSGNVGIGTTNPSVPLHVNGLPYSSNYPFNVFVQDSTAFAQDVGGGVGFQGAVSAGSSAVLSGIRGGKENSTSGNADGYLALMTRSNSASTAYERMRISSTGNVGIGTSSPTFLLDVNGNTYVRGTLYASTNGFSSNAGSDLKIYANNKVDLGVVIQQTTGFVGIGTTSPGYKLQVGAAADGSEARANAWNILSDERLKKNFQAIPNALDKILSLNGYFYQWNQGPDQKRKVGLKAQEVEKVFPEVISEGNDGYKSVSYNHLIAPVISAIKELYHKYNNQTESQNRQIASKVDQAIFKDVTNKYNAKLKEIEDENVKLKKENSEIKYYICLKDPAASFCK
ncbi:MAG: tail fiber domain-containing protein, partial [Bacteriovoracia bacterium]